MDPILSRTDSLDTHGGGLRAFGGFALLSILAFGLTWPLGTAAIGSVLFPEAGYVIPRPSAAGYAGMGLAGSNWAPSNPALRERVDADAAAIAAREGVAPSDIPPELVTASGSGIDPHLSPAAVAIQLPRIARARGVDPAALHELLEVHVEPPQFGVLGQPRVNVLAFNLALDTRHPAPAR
jgi:potassium-transporting ATPase KdpC subunit